jgi:hypothetical protein
MLFSRLQSFDSFGLAHAGTIIMALEFNLVVNTFSKCSMEFLGKEFSVVFG